MSLHQRIKKASDLILNAEDVRIISHYDADGIALQASCVMRFLEKK